MAESAQFCIVSNSPELLVFEITSPFRLRIQARPCEREGCGNGVLVRTRYRFCSYQCRKAVDAYKAKLRNVGL